MIVSALRGLVSLAVDAAECLLVLGTTGFARVDELWADTRTAAADRLADAEAENEVTEPADCSLGSIQPDDSSVFRSGGQLKEYGPRPRIATTPPTPPAAGVAPNPAAGDAPPSASFPTAGHPNLTAKDLRDASYAIQNYAERCGQLATNTAWTRLAERLETAANAMK